MQVRLPSLAAVLLPLLLLAPSALAHGEHEVACDRRADTWSHLDLWDVDLAPGAAEERTLGFEGCPLEEGWRVLLRGDATGPLALSLRQSGDEVGSWTWTGDGHFEAVTLSHTDFVTLRVENPADAGPNATARLYFDQTCLCAVKGTHLVPGPVWMNALADAGDTVSFNVTVAPSSFPVRPDSELPETITVRAVLPGHPDATRTWTLHPAVDPACGEGTRWTGCFDYSFEAPRDGRQDVLLWLDHDGGDAWSLSVRPVIEVEGDGDGRGAPGTPALALASVLVLVAVLRRRRRLAP